MKTINKYFLGAALLLLLVGCKDRMRELNTNPEILTSADPRYLYLHATQDWVLTSHWSRNGMMGGMVSNLQYMATIDNTIEYNDPSSTNQRIGAMANIDYGNFYAGDRAWGRYLNHLINLIDAYGDPQSPRYDILEYQRYAYIRNIAMINFMSKFWDIFAANGAAVFSEAFRIEDGILYPEYDIAQDAYPTIDAEIKAAVEALQNAAIVSNPYVETAFADYDRVFGWNPNTSGVEKVTDFQTIIRKWVKYGNFLRLKMAFTLSNIQPGLFAQILSEIGTDGLMNDASESAFYNYAGDFMGGAEMAYTNRHFASISFVAQLKNSNDPRLPLLVRPNDLYATPGIDRYWSWSYFMMKSFFPDSLEYRMVNGTRVPWGDMTREGNHFQGLTVNPLSVPSRQQPDNRITHATISWRVTNPMFPNPYVAVSPVDGNTYTVMSGLDTTFSVRIASPAQTRYWVKGAGSVAGTQSGGSQGDGNGDDGIGTDEFDSSTIPYRSPMGTYQDLCFMMSYMSEKGGTALRGRSAAQWYEAGVRASFDQILLDAQRYKIVIATDDNYPNLPTVNPNGLYTITPAQIDAYLAANPYNGVESIVAQVRVNCYTHDPFTYQTWRLLTSYPRIRDVNVLTYANQEGAGNTLTSPWLEKIMISTTVEAVEGRRSALPQPTGRNRERWTDLYDNVLTQQPGFGSTFQTLGGRLWYDTEPLRYITD